MGFTKFGANQIGKHQLSFDYWKNWIHIRPWENFGVVFWISVKMCD